MMTINGKRYRKQEMLKLYEYNKKATKRFCGSEE